MRFAVICRDKPGHLEVRLQNRAAHLAYIEVTGIVEMAGPFLEAGQMCGSLLVLETDSLKAAQDWAAGDPYGAFLPSPVATDANGDAATLRAVVFVAEGTPKGTARSPQEYVDPLLVLAGAADAKIAFAALHELICLALRRERPRVVVTFIAPEGHIKTYFEDGAVVE